MSNSFYEVLECRYIVRKDWVELYVRVTSAGVSDHAPYPPGWCKSLIPLSRSPLAVLKKSLQSMEYLQWERSLPPLI